MPKETLAQLRMQIAELEERNAALADQKSTLIEQKAELVHQQAALKDRIAAQTAAVSSAAGGPPATTVPVPRTRASHVGRSILAGILVVLGLIITPVALLVDFAQAQVTDTETFVAAYAPLAKSPAVQEAITEAVVVAVNANVDLPGITGGLVDGLQQLELPRFVSSSLDLLRVPLVDGANALIRWGVGSVLASDWFPTVWEQTLRLTHSQLMAVLRGDDNAIAQISGDSVSLQLGPVVALIKDQLIASGVTVARLIPDSLDITIPLADVQGIGNAKTAYSLAVASGIWLPIIAAALLIGGIAVAPRRRGWVMGTSIALGAIAILFAIGLNVGRGVAISANALTSDALGRIYDAATAALAVTLTAVIAIAVVGIVVSWLAGPTKLAVRARRGLDRFPAMVRDRLAFTNPFSRLLTRHRGLAYWLIAAAVIVTIVFFRPLSVGVVVVAVVVGVVLLLLVEVFRSNSMLPVAEASGQELVADLPAQDLAEDVAR